MALESRLLWTGAIPANRITIAHRDHVERTIDPAIEAAVDAEWQRQVTVAASHGVTIYDAPAYRMNRFTIDDLGMTIDLATIPYRYHAAFKAIHDRPDVRPEHADRILIVDSILHTADDCIVMHAVEKVVESETYLIGGTCSTSRMAIATGADLATYALDRIDAITGLRPAERTIGNLVALVENGIGCIHTIFDVTTELTSDDLLARFQPGPTSKRLVAIPRHEWSTWCATASGYMRLFGDDPYV